MSLKKFVQRTDVKEKFKDTFKKPKITYSKDILTKSLTKNYGMLGTAFDYLARFYIERVNLDNVFILTRPWVAETYVVRSMLTIDKNAVLSNIIDEAKYLKDEYIETGELNDDLLKACIMLAKIDILHRSAYPMDDTFYQIDSDDIQDLKNLYLLFIQHDWCAKEVCFLNPTFNEGSLMVGGADADVIIDNTLLDFKTVKSLVSNGQILTS